TNVMAHQLEARIRQQMMYVASRPGVEIIDAQNFVAAFQQAIAKVRSNKSGSASDEDATFGQHGQSPPGVAGGGAIIRVSLVPDLGVASRPAPLQPSNSAAWLTNQRLQSLGLTRLSEPCLPGTLRDRRTRKMRSESCSAVAGPQQPRMSFVVGCPPV